MVPSIHGSYQRNGRQIIMPVQVSGEPQALSVLAGRIRSLPGYEAFSVVAAPKNDMFSIDLSLDAEENTVSGAYRLEIQRDGVQISASDPDGLVYGMCTLFCLLRDQGGSLDCGVIQDKPLHAHRGFLLDCARHFFAVEELERILDRASLCKLNRMHWHLSDDQGYRLESQVFPELNEISSFRDDPVDGKHYGGYYTIDQVKHLVLFAKERGIEIIPEIDMPGHITAILRAHSELCCRGELNSGGAGFGVFPQILCGGRDETLVFVKHLLDEVCELFPYEQIHIGGDEAPKGEWKTCPHCQRRMKKLGLHSEEELQAWFTNEIADYLIQKGKRPICWNEALMAENLNERVSIQYWDDAELPGLGWYCEKRLDREYGWIYSYTGSLYFDFAPCLCPMRRLKNLEPKLRNGAQIPSDKLQGFEACLWSERIPTPQRLEEMAFPRLFALAELSWSGMPDYDDFLLRCEREIAEAQASGICSLSLEDADPDGKRQRQQVLTEWRPTVDMLRGMENHALLPIIRELVASKLSGDMPEEQLTALLDELMQ